MKTSYSSKHSFMMKILAFLVIISMLIGCVGGGMIPISGDEALPSDTPTSEAGVETPTATLEMTSQLEPSATPLPINTDTPVPEVTLEPSATSLPINTDSPTETPTDTQPPAATETETPVPSGEPGVVLMGSTPPAGYDCATEQSQIPLAECNALVTLYNSTDGPNWTNKTG